MQRISGILIIFALFSLVFYTPNSFAGKKERYQSDVRKMANETLSRLYRAQPKARNAVNNAAGYAVFSNVGFTFLFAGGGKGSGIAINNRDKDETFMKMVEGKLGLGLGLTKFRLIFVFDNEKLLDDFINKGWELDAQTTAAAKIENTGGSFEGSINIKPGIHLYQLTDEGLALEVTGNLIKFYKDGKLN